MSTVQTLVNRAARLLGQVAPNSALAADESADALVAINAMMDAWKNEELLVYARQDESLNLVAAQASYTLGPGGDLGTTRPVRIDDAYVVYLGYSYPGVKIISDQVYDAIPNKSSQSTYPSQINYRATMPAGTLYVYPVPSVASVLHLLTWTPLTAFAALTDTVSLPPGFEDAIAANLAIALAPEYECDPRDSVIKMARESKASIKRINSRPIEAYTELSALLGRRRGNFITGGA